MTKKEATANPIIDDCPVCERRKEVLQELEDYADGNPQLREGARHEYCQKLEECKCPELTVAAPTAWNASKGKNENPVKCKLMAANKWMDSCKVMSDEHDNYNWTTKKWQTHSHTCKDCGRRLPLDPKQQYRGEAVDWQLEAEQSYDYVTIRNPENGKDEQIPKGNPYVSGAKHAQIGTEDDGVTVDTSAEQNKLE